MEQDQVQMIDIVRPESVEVIITQGLREVTVWVNVDGKCRLRIQQIRAQDVTLAVDAGLVM